MTSRRAETEELSSVRFGPMERREKILNDPRHVVLARTTLPVKPNTVHHGMLFSPTGSPHARNLLPPRAAYIAPSNALSSCCAVMLRDHVAAHASRIFDLTSPDSSLQQERRNL